MDDDDRDLDERLTNWAMGAFVFVSFGIPLATWLLNLLFGGK